MNKIGQMKIQQMAFMLIAVVLFFALVGMFFLTFKFSNLKESAALLEEKNAILLAGKLAESPEFSCGTAFGTEKTNCVDFDKAISLKENSVIYNDFWGVSNIEIRKIYPLDQEVTCNLGNYPDCNLIKLRDNTEGTGVSSFVSLCRKESSEGIIYNKCEMGKIIITYEKP